MQVQAKGQATKRVGQWAWEAALIGPEGLALTLLACEALASGQLLLQLHVLAMGPHLAADGDRSGLGTAAGPSAAVGAQ